MLHGDVDYGAIDDELERLQHRHAGGCRHGLSGSAQDPRGPLPLSAAKPAHDDFEHGRLVGRAVLMPAALHAGDDGATASSHVAVTAIR